MDGGPECHVFFLNSVTLPVCTCCVHVITPLAVLAGKKDLLGIKGEGVVCWIYFSRMDHHGQTASNLSTCYSPVSDNIGSVSVSTPCDMGRGCVTVL